MKLVKLHHKDSKFSIEVPLHEVDSMALKGWSQLTKNNFTTKNLNKTEGKSNGKS